MKEASDRCVCANVCRVERVFELAGRGARVVLLMELCEGGDLLSRLQARGGRLGAAEGARAISMIARGLRALHEGGILHLDLKPENCLYETAAADATLKIKAAPFSKAARPRSRRACRPEAGRQKTACGK